jgi:hypothetical protein
MTDIDTNIAEFSITIDNIEEAFNLGKERKRDGHIFIADSDYLNQANPEQPSIFLTDSLSIYYLKAKRGTTFYNSIIKDKLLKHIFLSLYDDYDHDDLFELLKDILAVHPNLRSIELNTSHSRSRYSKNFSNRQCAAFCEGLKRTKSLRKLVIRDTTNLIDQKKIQMLADAINDNKNISLDIRVEFIEPDILSTLLESLKKNSRIKSAWLTGRHTYQTPWASIKEFIQENSSISQLIVKQMQFTDADVDLVMSALKATTTIQTLKFPLSYYIIDGVPSKEVNRQFSERIFPLFIESTITRQNSPLRTLKLQQLLPNDMDTLFKALKGNSTITSLKLGCRVVEEDPQRAEYYNVLPISDNTIDILNDLLTNNKTLKQLALIGSVCSDADLQKYQKSSVDWYKHNTTLTKLNLKANRLVEVLLGDALSYSKTLKSLKCTRHFISNDLYQNLLKNTTLEEIFVTDFYATGYDNCTFIKRNLTVKRYGGSFYGDEGDPFLQELANHPSITSVYLGKLEFGPLPPWSGTAIASLKKNWILTDFDMRNGRDNALIEPILVRNRQFKLALALIMRNIVRQRHTIFPMDIWRLIFLHLTPDVSLLT